MYQYHCNLTHYQYDPVTGAVSANEGDTSIPESTYTPDYGTSTDSGLDYSDIDTSDYQYGDLSSGLDYSGEDAYSWYDTTGDTTGTDTYSYQDYTGTASTDATTAYSTPEVADLSAIITEMFGNNLQSAIDAIRAKVDEMTSQYEAQLAAVPQQYQALRNQASAEAVMNQRIANEQLANLGLARSGQMLTTQAQTGAAMQNRMAEIDAAQQAAESEIQQAIFKLQSEGRADEAELIAANQKELTQALLDEYSRQQEAGQQQFENQLALSKFNYQQQADAQDLAMEESDKNKIKII